MESYKPKEIDCPLKNYFRNKRQRAINDMAPCEVPMISSLNESSKSGAGTANPIQESSLSSHGSISVIGRRRAMEDAVKVVPGLVVAGDLEKYDFFAVYDGHGGATVANACRDRLHQLLAKEITEAGWTDGLKKLDWQKVMSSCFIKMDEEVNEGSSTGDGEIEMENDTMSPSGKTMGSTAVVVVVGREEITVANCGDSRAVMGRGGFAIPLSRDHKPDRSDEKERIEEAGGRIINWNGNRVLGVLATSRSIGDQGLKPYVTSEPEVSVLGRTESDEFLIIASDGLWDVISNELACEVVRRCIHGQIKRRFQEGLVAACAAEAAALLAELAMARGSKENISVVVVELKNSV
ncbi:Phosphatase 2C family protein [Quillaja saponaria]|uniref:protein-serine/threonine phosphatase n=1 Tax=Quillaja saponaria TaxID=32244 RepID=A0AAD7KS60_QUISA|nr:Phosphatase 2C family protein [Quillaja saponaria]